jgi:hypothetical protein
MDTHDPPLDSQQKELLSTAYVEARLIREGFEIARPIRDKGIDIIVYDEQPGSSFRAVPIQLKSYRDEGFAVSSKYLDRDLVMIYVWHAFELAPRLIVIGHEEMLGLLSPTLRETRSWVEGGGWSQTRIAAPLRDELLKYENNWTLIRRRLDRARRSPETPEASAARSVVPGDVEFLRMHRVGRPLAIDAGSWVSRMRDEDER